MTLQPILIDGEWIDSSATGSFHGVNPRTLEALGDEYPVSGWADCDRALDAATRAAVTLRGVASQEIAGFLNAYADCISARSDALVAMAHAETALPATPRLKDVELPRTVDQLRQAAAASRDESWRQPTIDRQRGIRSQFESLGPVWVFGPNNFPFAFNSVAGGDFAAAIAAGNPVICKANSSHPGTTRLLAEAAINAMRATKMPRGLVQLIYRTNHADGKRLVADHRTAAIGYTGSRPAGLELKTAADAAGKPIYLELSSTNPVVILPGAVQERADAIADEFASSCLMGAGQFCTNPGLLILVGAEAATTMISLFRLRFEKAPVGTLLSPRVQDSLSAAVSTLLGAGAEIVTGGHAGGGAGCSFANTLLRVSAARFLANSELLQTEAFGNCSLCVVCDDGDEATKIINRLEGQLTACVYSSTTGQDDALYDRLAPLLRSRAGRLLNDRMPTGVAVSPAMNHGGLFPATGHPGFTAVGIPASLRRFARLACYDNVRPHRLPPTLRDANPSGAWRSIDGRWTQDSV